MRSSNSDHMPPHGKNDAVFQRSVVDELRHRALWLIDVRWWIIPLLFVGSSAAYVLGVNVEIVGLLCASAFVLLYNIVFQALRRRFETPSRLQLNWVRVFLLSQIVLDEFTLLAILPLTGGSESPFLVFVIFHVVFVALLLSPKTAKILVAVVCIVVAMMTAGELLGFLSPFGLSFRDQGMTPEHLPLQSIVTMTSFLFAMAFIAASTAAVAVFYRQRIGQLRRRLAPTAFMNSQMRSLVAIGTEAMAYRRTEHCLGAFTLKLKDLMSVRALSVCLLDDDGKLLQSVVSHGQLDKGIDIGPVEVARTPILRQVIGGRPFVSGRVGKVELLQFSVDLFSAGVASALLVPLRSGEGTIGVLGVYSTCPDRFNHDDVELLGCAARFVASFIECARGESQAVTQGFHFTEMFAAQERLCGKESPAREHIKNGSLP